MYTIGGNVDTTEVQLLGETVWQFPKKLNIELPYDPAIPPLGIYAKELKAGTQTYICMPVFIAALFAIALFISFWRK